MAARSAGEPQRRDSPDAEKEYKVGTDLLLDDLTHGSDHPLPILVNADVDDHDRSHKMTALLRPSTGAW